MMFLHSLAKGVGISKIVLCRSEHQRRLIKMVKFIAVHVKLNVTEGEMLFHGSR